jgi:hypothetical protein
MVIVAGTLVSCSHVNASVIDPIEAQLAAAPGQTKTVNLSTLLDGDWDELGLICSFTTIAKVNEGLEFEWKGAPSLDDSDRDFLVFTQDRHVLAWSEVPLEMSFCTYGSASTDGIRVVLRADAEMTFVKTKVDDPIGSLDEIWLVDPSSVVVERAVLEGTLVP